MDDERDIAVLIAGLVLVVCGHDRVVGCSTAGTRSRRYADAAVT